MQRDLSSTIAGAPKQGRKLSPVVIGGAALLLAAAASVATWQGLARRETSTTVTESSVVEVAPATVQPPSARPLSSELTVYIVGSQAEATRVMDTIREGNRLLDQFGRPPFNADVIVVTSVEQEEEIMRTNADAGGIRAGEGLPPITVIDLRGR